MSLAGKERNIMDQRITHRDLAALGILFLDKEEERVFLESVNDEFALLAGREAIDLVLEENSVPENASWKDVLRVLENEPDKRGEIVTKARTQLLRSLEERRKRLLKGEVGVP